MFSGRRVQETCLETIIMMHRFYYCYWSKHYIYFLVSFHHQKFYTFEPQAIVYHQSFGSLCSFSRTTFCMTQVFACHLYTSKRDCNIVKQCHHSSVRVWPLCAVVCSELFPNRLQLAVKKTHFNSVFIHGGGGSVFIAVIVAVKCAGSGNGLEIFCKALGFAGIKRCC